MGRKTVILDRDGTINREQGFVTGPEQLVVLPGAKAAVQRLCDAGFLVVVVTNQSGIARGLYTEMDLTRIHEKLDRELEGLPRGYLHCPHHPDPGFRESGYGLVCECRKPKAGMLHRADAIFGVDWERSYLVGDASRDLLMGKELPATRILVQSGKPWREQLEVLEAEACAPDFVVADLGKAVDVILAGL